MAETFIDCGMPLEKQLEYNLPEEKDFTIIPYIAAVACERLCAWYC